MRRLHIASIVPAVFAVLACCDSSAAANVPAPVTKTNVVRIPSAGNYADGTLTTNVTYSDTTATAAASTGNTIGLGRGFYFRLRTCVEYHLSAQTPVSSCAERTVDTRSNSGAVFTYAPSVTVAGRARPTTQPWAYFKAFTEVLAQNGSAWTVSAHSWPDNGLQGAGVAIPAQGASGATLPSNSTVTFATPFNTAINSGQPDSICTDQPVGSNGSALPSGIKTSHAAFAGAPAYYEVGLPTGAYAGQAPRGVMLVVHGGGWSATSIGGVQAMRPDADRWRARGWETVNLTYRPCGQTAADVLWFYDKARAWFGAGAKIGALGTSAGAHLALLLAASRPSVYCVVSQAGPTDLRTIQSEVAYDAASGQHTQTVGGRWVHNLAAAAFGEENLPSYSPAALAGGTLKTSRVLQAFSADDGMVPYGQAADLADAMRAADPAAYTDKVQLAAGTIAFGHGRVTQAALDDFYAREAQLVAPVTTATVALDKR